MEEQVAPLCVLLLSNTKSNRKLSSFSNAASLSPYRFQIKLSTTMANFCTQVGWKFISIGLEILLW